MKYFYTKPHQCIDLLHHEFTCSLTQETTAVPKLVSTTTDAFQLLRAEASSNQTDPVLLASVPQGHIRLHSKAHEEKTEITGGKVFNKSSLEFKKQVLGMCVCSSLLQ